jgi:hypothetical protein
MYRIPAILIFFSSLACYPQIPADFPVIGKEDLPQAKFQPARYFTSESLFGYMDGGAELYREYGITDAVITEFDIEKRHYKCEVFKMTGPEEAFGIYSVSKYKCLSTPDFSDFTCLNRYQLQICKGSYYISIINRTGSSADSLIALKAGKIITDKIGEPSADLSAYIPDINIDNLKGRSILAKGKLGLANGATEWEDYFKGMINYYALIYKTPDKTIISVKFTDPEDFDLFINFHGWNLYVLSVTDVEISSTVTLRLLGDNHFLIKINSATGDR